MDRQKVLDWIDANIDESFALTINNRILADGYYFVRKSDIGNNTLVENDWDSQYDCGKTQLDLLKTFVNAGLITDWSISIMQNYLMVFIWGSDIYFNLETKTETLPD